MHSSDTDTDAAWLPLQRMPSRMSTVSSISTATTAATNLTAAPQHTSVAASPTAAVIAAKGALNLHTLQHAFYRSFYRLDDASTDDDLVVHYNTTGIRHKFIPNIGEYTHVVCDLLHFSPEVYSNNWNHALQMRLKDAHPHFTESDFLQHCFGRLTSQWVPTHIASGADRHVAAAATTTTATKTPKHLARLGMRSVSTSTVSVAPPASTAAAVPAIAAIRQSPVHLFLNRLDMLEYQLRWKQLYKTLHQSYVHFDPGFYVLFYEIDASEDLKRNTSAMFLQWLEKWLFLGRYPNHRMFKARTQLISLVLRAIHDQGVDINFVVKTYLPMLQASGALQTTDMPELSDIERALFVFFRFGTRYQFYWNEAEMQARATVLANRFQGLNHTLRSRGNIYTDKSFARADTQFQAAVQAVQSKLDRTVIQMPQLDLSALNIDRNVRLLSTMCSRHFFQTYRDIHALPPSDAHHVDAAATATAADDPDAAARDVAAVHQMILQKFVPNVARVSPSAWGELNSMSVKSFVLSYMYNVYYHTRRRTMNKVDYVQFVKQQAKNCLLQIYAQCDIHIVEQVLETDLQFLIEHRKIIKLAKLTIQIALMLYLL